MRLNRGCPRAAGIVRTFARPQVTARSQQPAAPAKVELVCEAVAPPTAASPVGVTL